MPAFRLGAVYCENGLSIPEIADFIDGGKNCLKEYCGKDVSHISNEDLLTCQCDVLIPAALENQITEDNAEQIKAKVVIEAANGPTSVEADEILANRKIIVVP